MRSPNPSARSLPRSAQAARRRPPGPLRLCPLRPSLKALLAPLEQSGALAVDEQADGRDTIRLAAGALFPSEAERIFYPTRFRCCAAWPRR